MLTHLHADHILDACNYVVVRRYAPEGPYPALPLYGPAGTADRLAAAYGEGPLDDVYEFHDLTAGHIRDRTVHHHGRAGQPSGRDVRPAARARPAGAGVLRPTPPRATALIRLAQGADLFLCEASYLDGEDNPPDLHLTGREAGEVAEQGRGRPAACSPTSSRRGGARRTPSPRPRRPTPGRSRWPAPAPGTTI